MKSHVSSQAMRRRRRPMGSRSILPRKAGPPRRRPYPGLFGSREEPASAAREGGLGRLAAVLAPFAAGRLERHAIFNGWERVDDPAARTATIYKCDVNQVIFLDIERERYRIAVPVGGQSIAGMKTQGFAAIDRIVMNGSTGADRLLDRAGERANPRFARVIPLRRSGRISQRRLGAPGPAWYHTGSLDEGWAPRNANP